MPERPVTPSSLTYTPLQKVLHWSIAILVIFMVVSGITMGEADMKAPIEALFGEGAQGRMYDLHKEIGLIVLILMVARVALRLVRGAPPYYPALAPHEKIVSSAVHGLLYLLLLLVPLLGWIGVSAYPALPSMFGLFPMPAIVGPDRALAEAVFPPHKLLGLIVGGLVLLHILAALFHGIVKQDGVLSRMAR